ncbi:MAG: DUF6350 family protein [Microbacterium sp.]
MNRLLVALLAAVDAVIAAAVGVAAALAPLTLFWVFGLGGTADWGALWPAAVRVWQFGHFVPLHLTLGDEYVVAAGLPAEAASFLLSLAPAAFATFTAVFAARSGLRAARSGAWAVGAGSGSVIMALAATGLWMTSRNPVAAVYGWQAVLLPVLVFALPVFAGAIVGAWIHGDDGAVDALRGHLERHGRWKPVPAAAVRALGVAVAGLIGVGALLVAVATVLRGGEVIALYEAAHVDLVGVIAMTLGQIAYLPTLVVWGAAFAAGPGFAVGAGTAVSPVGTSLGVLPGIPVLGIVPETVSTWLLTLALAIVAVGFLAGWIGRTVLARSDAAASGSGPRLTVFAAIVVLGGAGAALLAVCASGAIGPDRLADAGVAAGPFAFAVGVELAVGAAIALFTPARRRQAPSASFETPPESPLDDADDADGGDSGGFAETAADVAAGTTGTTGTGGDVSPDDIETQPFEPTDPGFLRDES